MARGAGRGAELWLGETSSTYGGGTANVSASFVAGFMSAASASRTPGAARRGYSSTHTHGASGAARRDRWLDKLGIAAGLGHRVVARQTFAHSSYAVIGAEERGVWDARPNPDYWSTLLWRRLVGATVLATADLGEVGRDVRAYAFCAANSTRGAVVLVVLNTRARAVDLQVELLPRAGRARTATRADAYLLTSYPGVLSSRDVFLNGHVLRLLDERTGALPPLQPVRLAAGQPVRMQAKSYGFVVLHFDDGAGAAECDAERPHGAWEMVEERGVSSSRGRG